MEKTHKTDGEKFVEMFLEETNTRLDEIEPVLFGLSGYQIHERNYYLEIIDYLRGLYKNLCRESLYFRFRNLYRVASKIVEFFTVIQRSCYGFSDEELRMVLKTHKFFRRILANIGIHMHDGCFEIEAELLVNELERFLEAGFCNISNKKLEDFRKNLLISLYEDIPAFNILH